MNNRYEIISLAEDESFCVVAVFAFVHMSRNESQALMISGHRSKERLVNQYFARTIEAARESRVCGGGHFLGGCYSFSQADSVLMCSSCNTEP